MTEDALGDYRHKINQLDEQLLKLLSERQLLSQAIGDEKKKNKLRLHDPARESAILKKLQAMNPGPLPNEAIENIYREIFSASLAAQSRVSVGYLGPAASFSHEAALKQFGHASDLIAQPSFFEVFRGVNRGRFDFGVVPFENSSQGGVGETLDLFLDFNEILVCQEIRLRVRHNVLSRGISIDNIKKIYSHPQVFSQCARWLSANMAQVPFEETSSSSQAARLAAADDTAAAIAGKVASEIYGLNVLVKSVEDARQNVTRFLVISKQTGAPTGADKTSLICMVKDNPGALVSLLAPFSKWGINMTKIESRPWKQEAWRYVFFIDIEGHTDDEDVRNALAEAEDVSNWLRILGSYPRVED